MTEHTPRPWWHEDATVHFESRSEHHPPRKTEKYVRKLEKDRADLLEAAKFASRHLAYLPERLAHEGQSEDVFQAVQGLSRAIARAET